MSLKHQRILLILICLLAFGLRLPGLFWGVPLDRFSGYYHPDEGKVVAGGRVFPLDPYTREDLRYPTAVHYLYGMIYLPIRLVDFFDGDFRGEIELLPATLLARGVNIFLAVGAVALVYELGKKVYDPRVGLLGAGFLAVSLYHVRNASFSTTDVPLSFIMVLVMLGAFKLLEVPSLQNFALLGIGFGALIGMKYTGGLAVVGVAWIMGLVLWREKEPVKRRKIAGYGLIFGMVAALFFLWTTPAIILNPGGWIESLQYESSRVAQGKLAVWEINSWRVIWGRLVDAVGLPLAVAMAAGAAFSFRKAEVDKGLPMALGVLVCVGYFTNQMFARYYIFLLPLMALLAANVLMSIPKFKGMKFSLGLVLAVGIIAYSFAFSLLGVLDSVHDTRIVSAEYLEEHLPPGVTVSTAVVGDLQRGINKLPRVDGEKFVLVDGLEFPEYVILTSIFYGPIEGALSSGAVSAGYELDPAYPFSLITGTLPGPEVFHFYDVVLNGLEEQGFHYELTTEFAPRFGVRVEFGSPVIRIYQRVENRP